MCRGYAWCDDKSDLRACNQQITCFSDYDNLFSVSTINSDLVDGHSFCIYSNEQNNGEYDYITREDEDNLDIVSTSAVSLNYTKLEHCNNLNSNGNPGVMCGTLCMENYLWCLPGVSNLCNETETKQLFTTQDPRLCRNNTFWSEVSCNLYYENGDIAAHGLRCSGALQHCIYPWYVTSNYFYKAGFMQMIRSET